ncbi:RND transporter, HAE1/HME family, permease protein [Novosphingobium nitrogenifigens DSM 19370]|uniref:RND transporter, HAE1/HME family, permease protein n=1 Tax=Novosphingobium nitrogenifigens DSM 19370 TaxID=983920 RepID=F1ZAM8_9SPHN|nr:efflux RND transporter permease subunit [Novosphingobium nitrogenifigens]EGD58335.1 RND transporter, HAE1/HME family, permease protein [Novosphingobium nitrogenifigens DSM 19370]
MNISGPFIRRPVGTILLTIGVALAGIAAFLKLPVAPLPKVDIPTIMVQASLPGASPATMASTVASPLERRLQTIAGVNEITSRSTLGQAQVIMQFDLSRDIDGAARDVQAAIAASRADLPSTLKAQPTYRKMNPADAPILILTLTSATRSPAQIYDAVSNIVEQRLLQVDGVGNVELGGAALPSVRVEINPLQLARTGIALEDVRTALQSASANRPRGVIEGITTGDSGRAWQVYSNEPWIKAADFAPLIIAWRNGAPVHLSDVAKVVDGPEDIRTMGLFNGKKSVPIIVTRQPDANIVATVDALKAQLPALQAQLPGDIKLAVATDRTVTIRASLVEVEFTLLISTLLVVLVVSLFLQSWRATLIPAAAVIVSLLGTVGVMYLSGFLLDNLSLMALTVATGFVVDDAIVVVENIARHVEEGMKPFPAALRGAKEVGFTVLSISVSLVAVFIPLVFMGGILGRLLREFALTMTTAVGISLIASLTVTPMLASRVLVPEEDNKPADPFSRALFNGSRRLFDWMQRSYARQLDWALRHRGPVLLLLLGAVVLNVYCIAIAPKGFLPQQDTGSMIGGLRVDQSLSFNQLSAKMTRIEGIVRSDPAVDTVVAFAGGGRAGSGFMFVTLKARDQRVSVDEVIQRLRPRLGKVRGVSLFLNPVQDLQVGGRQTTSMYQYVLHAETPDQLADAGDRLVRALKAKPNAISDVDIDQQDAGASAYVVVDRDRASSLGVPVTTIDNTLYDAFGQRQVANIYQGLNQYHVVMEADPAFAGKPEALQGLYLPVGGSIAVARSATSSNASLGNNAAIGSAVSTSASSLVPLSTVAHWVSASTNAAVSHSDGEPSATVSFNLPAGASLGQASQVIAQTQAALRLPATVHGDFGGTAKVFQQSTATIPLLIVAAIFAIYIVLGILYESAIHPLTVLSTLPSAGLGAILALIVTGGEFDIIALIGVILLIGIVKKNAILIIDFAIDAERSLGMSPFDAIREASLLRFRPILMTTLAAALGALPLAIGFGDGAELRRPLGIAIVGGLLVSQVLTLLTTPVVYLALDKWRRRSPHEYLLARHGAADRAEA